jgi:hypothetical protein
MEIGNDCALSHTVSQYIQNHASSIDLLQYHVVILATKLFTIVYGICKNDNIHTLSFLPHNAVSVEANQVLPKAKTEAIPRKRAV